MKAGDIWLVRDVMTCRNPEPFTRSWTGSFQRYTGVMLLLDVFVDPEGEDPRDPDEGKAWRVLTAGNIVYVSLGLFGSKQHELLGSRDETR